MAKHANRAAKKAYLKSSNVTLSFVFHTKRFQILHEQILHLWALYPRQNAAL